MKLFEWLKCVVARVYTTQVKEDIPPGFRSHVFVFRVSGIWPMADDSPNYKLRTIAFFFFGALLFPLAQSVNIFYVATIQEAMDSSFISFACWSTTLKVIVIYSYRDSIRQILRIHNSLLPKRSTEINNRVISVNIRAHVILTSLCLFTWCLFIIQTACMDEKHAIWPFTVRLPYAFAHHRGVYWIVLVYQTLACLIMGVGHVGVQDSFFLALMYTECGHVAELKQRLAKLGTTPTVDGEDRDLRFYRDLVDCCKRYEDCSRWALLTVYCKFHSQIYSFRGLNFVRHYRFAETMNTILSPSFFFQFGVSGLVFCSTVYMLSEVNSGKLLFCTHAGPADIDSEGICIIDIDPLYVDTAYACHCL